MEALEVKQWLDIAAAGRVAIEDGDDVGAHRRADVGLGLQRLVEDLANQHVRQRRVAELLREVERERALEASVVEHRGV